MAFRLMKDALSWFGDLKNSKLITLDFDIYYFCLIAGLITRTKSDVPQSMTYDLVQYFPGDYGDKGKIIVSLFLKTEIEEMGISIDNKKSVYKCISKLIKHNSQTYLSDFGEKEINKYANGGFQQLVEWFPDKPRTIESFLPLYKNFINDNLV